MKPVYQSRPSTRDKTGDCFEACVATMLDVPLATVPDMTGHAREGQPISIETAMRAQAWFNTHGVEYVEIGMTGDLGTILANMNELHPRMAYVLTGRKASGSVHAVVARGSKVIHDPAARWVATDVLVGPVAEGFFRVGLLVNLC